jgi:hypothetical protein
MPEGYVYILTNPAMPGLIKIGHTRNDPKDRVKQINGATGVPLPFEIFAAVLVPDCAECERDVHDTLSHTRLSPNREFFQQSPEVALKTVIDCQVGQVTDLVSEFLPGHTVARLDTLVEEGDIHHLAYKLHIDPSEVPLLVAYAKPEEMRGIVSRLRAAGKIKSKPQPYLVLADKKAGS